MKQRSIYIILLGMALGFNACGNSYEERAQRSAKEHARIAKEDSAALKIATTPTMDCLPLFVGVEDSMFQKAGLTVHLRTRSSQIDGDTLVEGGHVEGFVTDLIRAERLQKRGTPLRYVATTDLNWQIVANKMARIKELKQMSDKMIAMTRYSATEFLAKMAVDSVRPKNEVYQIQINDIAIRLKMLINNEMDAIVIPEPQATAARLLQHPVLMDSKDKRFRLGVIAFREQALKNKDRKLQVDLFVKVYNQACDSITKHGVKHYTHVIEKYMRVDSKTIKALPHINYYHAQAPKLSDIDIARRYWK